MPKLPVKHQFIDLSDYGRPFARAISHSLKETRCTPVDVTLMFILVGIIASFCIVCQWNVTAGFLLVLKSILDAADGQLARDKKTPSFTGRYLDSVADILLNILFIISIWYITDGSLMIAFLAFIGIQLQGTLYNYYYVILRNKHNGDTTSRVFEHTAPIAFTGEKQRNVDILFKMYHYLYGIFDYTIYRLDKRANDGQDFPNWFMTMVSTMGLGFQLLIMAVMLAFHVEQLILPFFASYSAFIMVFIFIRKYLI